jgi:dTMP kinase
VRKGLFIVFEGIDGAGKSTQVDLACAHVAKTLGHEALVRTKDLGGSPLGELLRRAMYKDVGIKNMAPGVVDLLFLAGHVQNWHMLVQPALDAGKIVVSDRWWYSQYAYGMHRGASEGGMLAYNRMHGGAADILFFFTGDPEVFLTRANARMDSATHQHQKPWNHVEQQTKIAHEYARLYGERPEWRPVDCTTATVEQVHLFVRHEIDVALKQREMMR